MSIKRKLITIHSPVAQNGFLGAGHLARPVIDVPFEESDPFIILMDDMLDKQDEEPVGGPHPHAGFETVSLLIEGSIGNGDHGMKAGGFQLMTAGSGVVHTETMQEKAKLRLLQLWLTLPKKDRWAAPRLQDITEQSVPKFTSNGLGIKVYSGSLAGVTSPILNYTPVIIANFEMQANIITIQNIPASFNTFIYVLEGSVNVGEENKTLNQNQVGWLDKYTDNTPSELKLTAGETGARFVLYAGQPQGVPIVSHGPFIGDTVEDIHRLYSDYRHGKMKDILSVGEEHLIKY